MRYSSVSTNNLAVQMRNVGNNNNSVVQMKNDDTYQIDRNVFTMPFENVTIQAKWKIDMLNPNTGTIIVGCFLSIILIVLTIFTTIIYIRRKKLV